MDYIDNNTYTYFIKPYNHGWMVYHIEEGEHIVDMCFAQKEDATTHAISLNVREAKRVAEVKERLETSRKNLVIHDSPYYSITGYYGD